MQFVARLELGIGASPYIRDHQDWFRKFPVLANLIDEDCNFDGFNLTDRCSGRQCVCDSISIFLKHLKMVWSSDAITARMHKGLMQTAAFKPSHVISLYIGISRINASMKLLQIFQATREHEVGSFMHLHEYNVPT